MPSSRLLNPIKVYGELKVNALECGIFCRGGWESSTANLS